MLNKKYFMMIIVLTAAIGFSGCGKYDPSPNMVELKAEFTDSKWDGNTVPKDEVCEKYNKKGGSTPSLKITNLPKGTNKIVLTFSDNNPRAKMLNGGHGVIGYKVSQDTNSLIIPPLKGQTFDLPVNFESIADHRGTQWGLKAGVYLPPCSGGRGNPYDVIIEAIHEYKETDQKPMLLGDTRLRLGTY